VAKRRPSKRKPARRRWPGATLLGSAAALALASQSCVSALPPAQVEDLCGLVAERSEWYSAAARAAERWNVAPSILLAVIHQESRFRADARPYRRLLGVPIAPASSAYGYSQALDGTWREYLRDAGRLGARRDDFSDAVDFVGWYADRIHRETRIAKDDAFRLYLAYHEGPGGFSRGSYAAKPWLHGVARRVAYRASVWHRDAQRCGLSEPRAPI
jgi:hypothetical protein